MPHSLKAKLSGLHYKGMLEDKDYKRLCHSLDLEKAEQEQKSGKWISVSERLPEDGTWNLFTDGKNVSVERYKYDVIDHFYPSGRWFDLEDVVAWMPLPKPYKPQESEDEE